MVSKDNCITNIMGVTHGIMFESRYSNFSFSLMKRVNLEARGYAIMFLLVNISLLDCNTCTHVMIVG